MRALFLLAAAGFAAMPLMASAQSTDIVTQQAMDVRQLIQTNSVFIGANQRGDTWYFNGIRPESPARRANLARRAELGRCILETDPAQAVRFATGAAGPEPLQAAFKSCGSDGLYGLRSSRIEQRRYAILGAIAAAQAARP